MNSFKYFLAWLTFVLFASGLVICIVALIQFFQTYNEMLKKEKPQQEVVLFTCYKLEGTSCTVTSNKHNPCSYKVTQCRTPNNDVVFESERYYEPSN